MEYMLNFKATTLVVFLATGRLIIMGTGNSNHKELSLDVEK